jgi:apolipoprotein N-acyltransferase
MTSTFNRFVTFVILSQGLPRLGIACSAGALSALALAPLDLFPVLFVTLPILVLLLDGASDQGYKTRFFKNSHFWIGWAFGLGYFVAGLYWIGFAFMVEAETYAWLMPLAVLVLPAGLAIFYGLACLVAGFFWDNGYVRIIAVTLGFTLAEWLRGTLLTGFPWNSLGTTLAFSDAMMQIGSVVGLYGMTAFACLIFAAPAALLPLGGARGRDQVFVCFAVLLFAGSAAYGFLRLQNAETEFHQSINIRIVQPNIAQADKWRPEMRQTIMDRYIELSSGQTGPGTAGLITTTHLIWPESAFPFLLTENPDALSRIASLLPLGSSLITGAVRADPSTTSQERRFFNSLFVIGDNGTIQEAYDKVHLVPFGEYLPFEPFLRNIGLEPLVEARGTFTSGTQQRVIRADGAPAFLPLICYEAIFPRLSQGHDNAHWLLNLTNDAWFGDSTGPYQHLRQARLRSVETGKPLIRAANTGISMVGDGYGRVLDKIDYNVKGIIDTRLPLKAPATLYTTYGYRIVISIVLFLLVLCIYTRLSSFRKRY